MVGCLGIAPSSRRLRAGTSLSKFATRANAKAELNQRGEVCEASLTTGFRVAENLERRSPNRRGVNRQPIGSSRIGVRRSVKSPAALLLRALCLDENSARSWTAAAPCRFCVAGRAVEKRWRATALQDAAAPQKAKRSEWRQGNVRQRNQESNHSIPLPIIPRPSR
jgi:hypothetical protein